MRKHLPYLPEELNENQVMKLSGQVSMYVSLITSLKILLYNQDLIYRLPI